MGGNGNNMTTPAIILALLVLPAITGRLVNRVAGRQIADIGRCGVWGIALVFVFTGVGHFLVTASMAEMLPPWVPGRIPLVYFTGVLEIAAGLAVLVPSWRTLIGRLLILMLILFLPVNIYAAVHQIDMGGHAWGPVYLLIRVPLQVLLIGWVWWFAVRPWVTAPVDPLGTEVLDSSQVL